MASPDLEAQVNAAKAYEALLVPALTGQWVPQLLDAAGVRAGQRILDVACGTGVVAREAQRRTGPTGYVAGLDPSAGMLAVAKQTTPAVDWREGVAESIPFPPDSFDAVVSQFGLMFTQPEQAIREMLRVSRPDGRVVAATWDAIENIPAYAAEARLFEELAGSRAAAPLRAPFALGDREDLTTSFARAGASRVTVDTLTGVARFPSIRVMVEADLRGWLPAMGVNLAEDQIIDILAAAEPTLRPFMFPGEGASFALRMHLVVAGRRG